jgi:hypothetical protein
LEKAIDIDQHLARLFTRDRLLGTLAPERHGLLNEVALRTFHGTGLKK